MGNCQPGPSAASPVDDGELHARGPSDFYGQSAPSAPSRARDRGSGGRAQQEAREKLRQWKDSQGEAQDPPNMAAWGQAIDDPLVKMLVDSMPSSLVATPTAGAGGPPEEAEAELGSLRPYTFGTGAPQEGGARWDSDQDGEADDNVPAAPAGQPDAPSLEAEDGEDLADAGPAGLAAAGPAAEGPGDGVEEPPPAAEAADPAEPRELTDTYSYAGAGVGVREEAGDRPEPSAGRTGGAAPATQPPRRATDPWAGRPQRQADFADLPVQFNSAPPVAMTRAPYQPDSGAGGGPVPFANVMEAKLKAKEWQFQLKMEMKMIEREIKKVRKDQGKLQKDLSQKASSGRTVEVERLARSVVTVRRTLERLEQAKESMRTVELELSQAVVVASVRHSLQVSADVVREMNSIARGHEAGSAMEVMRREMAQCAGAEVAIEAALHEEDDEEVMLEVQRVLEEAELDRIGLLEGSAAPPAGAPPTPARGGGGPAGARARVA